MLGKKSEDLKLFINNKKNEKKKKKLRLKPHHNISGCSSQSKRRDYVLSGQKRFGKKMERIELTESSLQYSWGASIPRPSNTLRFGSFSSSLLHEQENSPSL